MYLCEICNVEMGSLKGMKLHKETVHLGIVHKCLICDHVATQKSNLATHYRGLHKVPLVHFCDHCTMIFPNIDHLYKHIEDNHGNKGFSCKQCDFKSLQKAKLYQHIKSEHEHLKKYRERYKTFNCQNCKFSCQTRSGWTMHNRIKHLGIEYPCNICGKKFGQKSSLIIHQTQTVHAFKEKKVYQCKKCSMTFDNNTSLYEHLTTVHKEKNIVKCSECDYFSYGKKYMRTRHKAMHLRQRLQEIIGK